MTRPMSKSQQKRFAVQKDRNKRAKRTKVHEPKVDYSRATKHELLAEIGWDDDLPVDIETS